MTNSCDWFDVAINTMATLSISLKSTANVCVRREHHIANVKNSVCALRVHNDQSGSYIKSLDCNITIITKSRLLPALTSALVFYSKFPIVSARQQLCQKVNSLLFQFFISSFNHRSDSNGSTDDSDWFLDCYNELCVPWGFVYSVSISLNSIDILFIMILLLLIDQLDFSNGE